MQRLLASACLAVAASAPVPFAFGQPASENAAAASVPPTIRAAVEALDAAELSVRDAAARTLAESEAVTLEAVEAMLSDPGLSAEQRHRVRSIGLERFAATPRAGLGVRFGGAVVDGVRLESVLPAFPAADVLRPGDIVRSINGRAINNTSEMGSIILSHDPGEVLAMEVERAVGLPPAGEDAPPIQSLDLRVPLGAYEDLESGIDLTPARLSGAWDLRLSRRIAEPEPAVIGTGLAPLVWLGVEGYDATGPMAPETLLKQIPAWRSVSFGGQPRSAIAGVEVRRGDLGAMRRRGNVALQADGVYDRVEEALAGYRAIAQRLAELNAALESEKRAIAARTQPGRFERIEEEKAELGRALDEITTFLAEPDADSDTGR